MNGRRILQIGGIAAGAILVVLGIGSLALSINAHNIVGDELGQQSIVGSADMSPDAIKAEAEKAGLPSTISLPDCDVAGQVIENGSDARCFAQYMRIHALEASS